MKYNLFLLSFLGLFLIVGCGKDEQTASPVPAAVPPTAPSAPVSNPPNYNNGQPNQGQNQGQYPNQGQNQGQNQGGECLCDRWGCYVCGADDWCCPVNSCSGNRQYNYNNRFSRMSR